MGIRISLLAILAIATCLGQAFPEIPSSQYAALKQLLGLTDDQISKMMQAQTENAQFAKGKERRIAQVNSEIDEETAKSSLDAMALGERYLELEVICRELRDAATALPKRNLALLTDGQKVKLKVLEEAVSLAPTTSQAQALQLLPGSSGFGFASFLFGGTGGIPVIRVSPNVSACRASGISGFSILPLDAGAK